MTTDIDRVGMINVTADIRMTRDTTSSYANVASTAKRVDE